MDDFALVLNAGSSSLKFCVFQRPEGKNWRLEARGQIEGIGTSPQLSVKDGAGTKIAEEKLDPGVSDGRKALDALAAWLRSIYGGARVLGVGHRVVHGGARFHEANRSNSTDSGRFAQTNSTRAASSTLQSGCN